MLRILYKLIYVGLTEMFSDPHCRYTEPACGSRFIQVGGQGFSAIFSDPHYTNK